MGNNKVVVYTMSQCPYCEAAKKLLKSREIDFEEVKISQDDDAAWDALYQRSQMKTVPQIFAGNELIGGYTELAALDKQNGLRLLKKVS